MRKCHDIGWKNSYQTSADVSMLGYGCGVSQYPQLFVEDVYIYQMLPLPYLRSFDGGPGDKLIKQKWVLNLANLVETLVWECIEYRIMRDDSEKKYKSILVKFERKIGDGKRNTTINMQNLGKLFLLLWL